MAFAQQFELPDIFVEPSSTSLVLNTNDNHNGIRLSNVVVKQYGASFLHIVQVGETQSATTSALIHNKFWTSMPKKGLAFLRRRQKQLVSTGMAFSELSPEHTSTYLAMDLPVRVRIEDATINAHLTNTFHKPSLDLDWPAHTYVDLDNIRMSLHGDGLPVVVIGWSKRPLRKPCCVVL